LGYLCAIIKALEHDSRDWLQLGLDNRRTKGVGQSTTAAVVTALLTILLLTFLLSWLMFQGTGSAVI